MIFSVAFTILLILIAILFALVMMLLFIPFAYASSGSYYDAEGSIEARIDWIYGLVRLKFAYDSRRNHNLEVRLFGFVRKGLNPAGKKDQKAVKRKTRSNKERKREGIGGFSLNMLPEIQKSVRRVLGKYRPKLLSIDATIGFEDAYHTGLMCAGLSSLSPLLESYDDIRVRPDFQNEIIEGSYALQGRITLIYIIYEALRLYFSKPFKEQRRYRKNHRVFNAEKGVQINNNQVEVI